jgi:hypothetical protein
MEVVVFLALMYLAYWLSGGKKPAASTDDEEG